MHTLHEQSVKNKIKKDLVHKEFKKKQLPLLPARAFVCLNFSSFLHCTYTKTRLWVYAGFLVFCLFCLFFNIKICYLYSCL